MARQSDLRQVYASQESRPVVALMQYVGIFHVWCAMFCGSNPKTLSQIPMEPQQLLDGSRSKKTR
ncbi:hypothetical protein CFP56_035137 [Quercus suber]|uniref:Uncharacterized protein n=1 Tax=Quercus suber TaxID=58331 RepID=A0AAW0JAA5_QUESU